MTDTNLDLGALVRQVLSLGNGPKAELRRLDPRRADSWPTTFWEMYVSHIEPHLGADAANEGPQRTWATILAGMALLEHGHIHPGTALAEAGYSEMRLNRLLSARDDRLIDEFRTATRFLAAKRQTVDWSQFARLLTSDSSSPAGDATRRHLAGAYYRTLAAHASR